MLFDEGVVLSGATLTVTVGLASGRPAIVSDKIAHDLHAPRVIVPSDRKELHIAGSPDQVETGHQAACHLHRDPPFFFGEGGGSSPSISADLAWKDSKPFEGADNRLILRIFPFAWRLASSINAIDIGVSPGGLIFDTRRAGALRHAMASSLQRRGSGKRRASRAEQTEHTLTPRQQLTGFTRRSATMIHLKASRDIQIRENFVRPAVRARPQSRARRGR